ncbi:MAG: trehalose-phosphatase [Longimonas sp.]|uniref:trehalose-phosphatase n=1 Tax=Longimonas sp. TaxID=2039626 RepID=UPI003351D2BB
MSTPPRVDSPLFFLDYDGTLAPIVDDPDAAYPHPDVPAVVQALRERYPLWIITGRDLRSLGRLFPANVPAIGLHGAQYGTTDTAEPPSFNDETVEALSQMQANVPSVEGLHLEAKPPTFAVHYRKAHDADDARRRLQAWVDTAPDFLEAIWGKKVVELRHQDHTKGQAVREVADEHPGRTPVYLGDDVTDEDAFNALADYDACTVKVGPGDTAADYRLDNVEDVVDYLKRYID